MWPARISTGVGTLPTLCVILLVACSAVPPEADERPREGRSAGSLPPAEHTESRALPEDGAEIFNVLLITVDTLRWDAVGFSGVGDSVTPALDRLAARGVTFLNAHAHNVVTLPSHANILTGLYPFQHGVRDNQGFVLPEQVPTLATLLRREGFETGAFVGAFVLDSRFGLAQGFQVYDDRVPEGIRRTDLVPAERRGNRVIEPALEWWRERPDRRKFLWVHLFDPHAPYDPPEPYRSRFVEDPYRGEVAATDAFLEPLLETAIDREQAPTLVVFTADHGEALGDHGELTHGTFAYEATLKVPLVVWYPGIRAGERRDSVRHVDILPTVLDLLGLEPVDGLPGRSLLAFEAETEEPPSYLESLTPTLDRGWAPLRGIILDGYKLISLPIPELYDLAADPGEQVNRFEERTELARRLLALLPVESRWPPERGEVDAETVEALRSLGYLGGVADAKATFSVDDDPKRLIHLDNKLHRVIDLYHRRQLEEAARLAAEIVEERSDMGVAYYYWAQILLEQDRLAEAIEVMQRSRLVGVATPATLRQLGLSLAETGRAGEAVPILEPLAAAGEPDSLNAFGLVLSESGQQARARSVLEQVFEADPDNATAHESLALVALRQQRWEAARDHARRALDFNDGLPLAWNYLATALYNLGEPRAALLATDRALALEPENLDVLYNAAVVAMEVGDRERARRALQGFIDAAPAAQFAPDIESARQLLRQLED